MSELKNKTYKVYGKIPRISFGAIGGVGLELIGTIKANNIKDAVYKAVKKFKNDSVEVKEDNTLYYMGSKTVPFKDIKY